ncbi:MAG: ABC transporter ATP-binding protein [Alphaproteobacteria bacterium]
MSGGVLSLDNVSKRFGDKRAVDGVTLDIDAGERLALIGHNGAGKTTLFKMILGLLPPTAGDITVLGDWPGCDRARKHVAFLPENIAFHRSMTGREALTLLARLKAVGTKSVAPLLDKVGLADAADRRIRTYSKGMRQRLGLAQALLGEPKLLLLDEPTSGLDPLLRRSFYAMVDELAASGATVLLSSHLLTELEARTDRVAIMRDGRLVACGPISQLRQEAALPLRIRLAVREAERAHVAAALNGQSINGQTVSLSVLMADKMKTLHQIAAFGDAIEDIELIQPTLDDLYVVAAGDGVDGSWA